MPSASDFFVSMRESPFYLSLRRIYGIFEGLGFTSSFPFAMAKTTAPLFFICTPNPNLLSRALERLLFEAKSTLLQYDISYKVGNEDDLNALLDNEGLANSLFFCHFIGRPEALTAQRLKVAAQLKIVLVESPDLAQDVRADFFNQLPFIICIPTNEDYTAVPEQTFSWFFYQAFVSSKTSIKEAYRQGAKLMHKALQKPEFASAFYISTKANQEVEKTLVDFVASPPDSEETDAPLSLFPPSSEAAYQEENLRIFRAFLQQKSLLYLNSKEQHRILLTQAELDLYEKYQSYLPLTDLERDLIVQSRKLLRRHEKSTKASKMLFFVLLFALFIGGLVAWSQYLHLQEQVESLDADKRIQKADFLAYIAEMVLTDNPTKALRVAQEGCQSYPTLAAQRVFYQNFYSGQAYYTAQWERQTVEKALLLASPTRVLLHFKDGSCALFDESGKQIYRFDSQEFTAVTSNGKTVLLAQSDGSLQYWQGKDALEIYPAYEQKWDKLLLSPKGDFFLSGADTAVWLWQKGTKEPIQKLVGLQAQLQDFDLALNDSLLFTLTADSLLALWTKEGELLQTHRAESAAFLDSGRVLIFLHAQTATLLDLRQAKRLMLLPQSLQLQKLSEDEFLIADKNGLLLHYRLEGNRVLRQAIWENTAFLQKIPQSEQFLNISKDKNGTLVRLSNPEDSLAEATLRLTFTDMPQMLPQTNQTHALIVSQQSLTLWRILPPYTLLKAEDLKNYLQKKPSSHAYKLKKDAQKPNIWLLYDSQERLIRALQAKSAELHPKQNLILTQEGQHILVQSIEGDTLTHIKGAYQKVKFSPQGTLILVEKDAFQHLIFDLEGTQRATLKATLPSSKSGIKAQQANLTISPNEEWIVLGLQIQYEQENTPYLIPQQTLQVGSGKVFPIYPNFVRGKIREIAFTPDSRYLLTSTREETDFWTPQGLRLRTIKGGNLQFAPKQKLILSTSSRHFHISSMEGYPIFTSSPLDLQAAHLSQDESALLLLHTDGTLKKWAFGFPYIAQWLQEARIYQLDAQESRQYAF
jgi:WD40 repeat protein